MKKKIFWIGLSILLIALLQSTVMEYIVIYGVKPNLLLVFIVSAALLKGNFEGAVIGFFCGLTQDILGGKVIGFYAMLGLYTGLVVGSLNKRLYRENILVVLFFTFASTVVYEWLVYFLNIFYKAPVDLVFAFKSVILPEAVYNSGISIFIYVYVMKLYEKFTDVGKVPRKY